MVRSGLSSKGVFKTFRRRDQRRRNGGGAARGERDARVEGGKTGNSGREVGREGPHGTEAKAIIDSGGGKKRISEGKDDEISTEEKMGMIPVRRTGENGDFNPDNESAAEHGADSASVGSEKHHTRTRSGSHNNKKNSTEVMNVEDSVSTYDTAVLLKHVESAYERNVEAVKEKYAFVESAIEDKYESISSIHRERRHGAASGIRRATDDESASMEEVARARARNSEAKKSGRMEMIPASCTDENGDNKSDNETASDHGIDSASVGSERHDAPARIANSGEESSMANVEDPITTFNTAVLLTSVESACEKNVQAVEEKYASVESAIKDKYESISSLRRGERKTDPAPIEHEKGICDAKDDSDAMDEVTMAHACDSASRTAAAKKTDEANARATDRKSDLEKKEERGTDDTGNFDSVRAANGQNLSGIEVVLEEGGSTDSKRRTAPAAAVMEHKITEVDTTKEVDENEISVRKESSGIGVERVWSEKRGSINSKSQGPSVLASPGCKASDEDGKRHEAKELPVNTIGEKKASKSDDESSTNQVQGRLGSVRNIYVQQRKKNGKTARTENSFDYASEREAVSKNVANEDACAKMKWAEEDADAASERTVASVETDVATNVTYDSSELTAARAKARLATTDALKKVAEASSLTSYALGLVITEKLRHLERPVNSFLDDADRHLHKFGWDVEGPVNSFFDDMDYRLDRWVLRETPSYLSDERSVSNRTAISLDDDTREIQDGSVSTGRRSDERSISNRTGVSSDDETRDAQDISVLTDDCKTTAGTEITEASELTASAAEASNVNVDRDGNIGVPVNDGAAPRTFGRENNGSGTDQNPTGLGVRVNNATVTDTNNCTTTVVTENTELTDPTTVTNLSHTSKKKTRRHERKDGSLIKPRTRSRSITRNVDDRNDTEVEPPPSRARNEKRSKASVKKPPMMRTSRFPKKKSQIPGSGASKRGRREWNTATPQRSFPVLR